MVLGFVGNLLGGLFGSRSSGSTTPYSGTQAGMSTQHSYNVQDMATQYGYDVALANQGYNLSTKLNQQTANLSKNLMAYQYNAERWARRTSFLDTRYDLESAGYNPLLALGQQSQGLPVGMSAPTNNVNVPDSNAVFSAIGAYNNTRQISSNIDSSRYTNDLNLALAEKARSETRGQDINNGLQDMYGATKMVAELRNMERSGLLSEAQTRYYSQQILESASNVALNSARTAEARWSTERTKQEYDLSEPQRRFAKKHPVAHGTLSRINPVSAIGGIAGLKYMMKK